MCHVEAQEVPWTRMDILCSASLCVLESGADSRDPPTAGLGVRETLNLLSPRVCSPHLLKSTEVVGRATWVARSI